MLSADETQSALLGAWRLMLGKADGFNLLPPNVPTTLNDFADLIVPEMQRRGLYRTEYEGKTLRENLGVGRPRPVWQHDEQQRAG